LDINGFENVVFPIINGYVGIRTINCYHEEFNFVVIARKDSRRSGMRFLVRGADHNGNVANFAETEQILIHKDAENRTNFMSYLQLRGSIPLLWVQAPNLELNPLIQPREQFNDQINVFRKHVSDLSSRHGKIIIVNLIDGKKDQKNIGDFYGALVKEYRENKSNQGSTHVEYVWFDFHKQCAKMKYDNLSKLLKTTSISSSIQNFDFTHVKIQNSRTFSFESMEGFDILNIQKGVFRTNCIDSLDRTNVVQTVFARQIMFKMLYILKLAEEPSGEPFESFNPVFEASFKNLWADHGDYLAKAYSGTGALKSDFVRTGKRTKIGALEDGVKTCTRFYINNFCDGYNQDCHDYFLNKLNPQKSNFKEHGRAQMVWIILFASIVLSFTLYHFSIGIAFPNEYESGIKKILLKFLIFLGVFVLTIRTVFTNVKKMIIDTPTIDHF
jgi:hypothetical protein